MQNGKIDNDHSRRSTACWATVPHSGVSVCVGPGGGSTKSSYTKEKKCVSSALVEVEADIFFKALRVAIFLSSLDAHKVHRPRGIRLKKAAVTLGRPG